MITYDISKSSHYTSKADGERAFVTWLEHCGIAPSQFPFKVETFKHTFKGNHIIFRVVSWGCYLNAANNWIVFIAYRCSANGANVQYNWLADENGLPQGDPVKHEFVN